MGTNDYKRVHAAEAVEVSVNEIKLREYVHKQGNPDYVYQHKSNADCLVIVHRTRDGYILVSGWSDYMECVNEGYETVRAIIANQKRGEYMRQYGTTWLPIDEIEITPTLAESQPKDWKIQRARDRLSNDGQLDKPLTLNKNKVLVDGYTRYLVAKEVGMEYVPIIYSR